MKNKSLFSLSVICFWINLQAQTWQSNMVKFGTDGKLTYTYTNTTDSNRIPDFSYAGYKSSNVPIPNVTKILSTLTPVAGDNTIQINNAITAADSITPDSNGIRGVILLKKGNYNMTGTINLNVSGVILRGEGSGSDTTSNTVITALGNTPNQRTVLIAGGGGTATDGWNKVGSIAYFKTNWVKVGDNTFTVDDASSFNVGDNVIINSPCTQAWINAVDGGGTNTSPAWTVGSLPLQFKRIITAINGNTVTIDAPVFNHLKLSEAQSQMWKEDRSNIKTEIGIEDLRIDIQNWTDMDTSESHAWQAIDMFQVEDCWARNVVTLHFGQAGFRTSTATRVTIDSCQAIDPVATITAERRYNFEVYTKSTLILFKNCFATNARHSYVSNGTSYVSGIVFLRCQSQDPNTSSEGHRMWSMGLLYDNLKDYGNLPSDSRVLGLYNRGSMGTSHGWSAAHSVAWNCDTRRTSGPAGVIVCQQPPTAQNYVIGGCGAVNLTASIPYPNLPLGYVEGFNQCSETLVPQSLFEQQLADRLLVTGLSGSKIIQQNNIQVFPNPSINGIFNVSINDFVTNIYVEVYDMSGKIILNDTIESSHQILDMSNMNNGFYMIKFLNEKVNEIQKICILK